MNIKGDNMNKIFDLFPVLSSERITIKKLEKEDLKLLKKMESNQNVYKYVPTFVPEKETDPDDFINNKCDACFKSKDEIILGVYLKKQFCGIAELYHYKPDKKEVSIGGRFDEEYWNKGIATEALSMAIEYLFKNTDITRICASNIVNNQASGRVLEKSGFRKIAENVVEDWGYENKVIVDKWCLEKN